MQKRPNAVTFKGGPITLVGPQLKAGDAAPDFTCLKVLDTVTLASTPAKVRLFSVVPSLDTPVCSEQTKKFESQLAGDGFSMVEVLTMCPTGWFVPTAEGPEYMGDTLGQVHVMGELKAGRGRQA